jgi:uncharacterized protein
MSIQKKVFTSEIKGIDENEMTLTAAISTDAVDRMREVLDPAGVDLKHYQKNPVVLFGHDYNRPPIGKAMWVRKDGQMIISKVKFANTPFAIEIFDLYKEGFMKSFSVGFIPKETEWGKEEDRNNAKKPRLTYRKWELLEFSAVPVPANPEALALAMQKGLLKDESLIKSFEQVEEQPVSEFNHEEEAQEKEEEPQKIEIESIRVTGLEELLAENKELKDKLAASEKENGDLRYRR